MGMRVYERVAARNQRGELVVADIKGSFIGGLYTS